MPRPLKNTLYQPCEPVVTFFFLTATITRTIATPINTTPTPVNKAVPIPPVTGSWKPLLFSTVKVTRATSSPVVPLAVSTWPSRVPVPSASVIVTTTGPANVSRKGKAHRGLCIDFSTFRLEKHCLHGQSHIMV